MIVGSDDFSEDTTHLCRSFRRETDLTKLTYTVGAYERSLVCVKDQACHNAEDFAFSADSQQ